MDGIALTLFGIEIHWYGIIIAFALIVGVVLGVFEAKRRGFRSEMVLDFILIAIPVSIIGARIYYVVFEWQMYADNLWSIFAIWNGGLAIYGAVIGGVISAIIFFKWTRVRVGTMMDIAAPSLVISQAIGRWGNFVNQEAYGGLIENAKWQWFPMGVNIDGAWYQATFFYESMWNLIVFIFLVLIRKRVKIRGGIFALYLICYGFGRFWIEQLRADSLWWGPFRVSQVLSVILVLAGTAYLIIMSRRKKELIPYKGVYDASLSPEEVKEYKANAKQIRAQEAADRAAEQAEDMIAKNNAAEEKVKKAEEKAEKAKKKLEKFESEIKISEIKVQVDESSNEKEKKKAQKAKAKKAETAAQIASAKAKKEYDDE